MPVRKVGNADFLDFVEQKIEAKMDAMVDALEYVGNECIREMRENRTYTDRTGNLRSSTGFVIVRDGRIVRASSFAAEKEGAEGSSKGMTCAEEVASTLGKDKIALVLVAGMNYAMYVESRGYNVMDSAISLAKRLKNELIDDLLK